MHPSWTLPDDLAHPKPDENATYEAVADAAAIVSFLGFLTVCVCLLYGIHKSFASVRRSWNQHCRGHRPPVVNAPLPPPATAPAPTIALAVITLDSLRGTLLYDRPDLRRTQIDLRDLEGGSISSAHYSKPW